MTLPSFPNLDLFAAGINALYGVLLARNPSHDRGYSVAGLLIMAFLGGIGGGVTRDVLLNHVPGPFLSPIYLVVCTAAGLLGLGIYRYAASKEEGFRIRVMAYFKSFSLPWFAILGAHKALEADLGIFSAVVVGVIATTAGGVFIDVVSGVTPEIFRPSEHVVTTAVIAGLIYAAGATLFHGTLLFNGVRPFYPLTFIAAATAFTFRMFAVRDHWKQIVPFEAPAAGPHPPRLTKATSH